jgi:hypothetical protein
VTDYFVHDHQSGRFTVSPEAEEAMVDYSLHGGADLFTTTEISKNSQARCLREPGFTAVFGNKGSRDDCGLAIRDERFRTIDKGTETLSDRVYETESFGTADTHEGAYAVIEDKHAEFARKSVGVVVVVHLPHGMQDDLRLGRPGSDVAKAYRSIMRGARRLATRLRRKYRAHWVMIVGDWNLNLKNSWVPLFLKGVFPTYHLNFQKPYPKRGTWGPMIFDFALLWGIDNRRNPRILSRKPGFDHLGWRQLLG